MRVGEEGVAASAIWKEQQAFKIEKQQQQYRFFLECIWLSESSEYIQNTESLLSMSNIEICLTTA